MAIDLFFETAVFPKSWPFDFDETETLDLLNPMIKATIRMFVELVFKMLCQGEIRLHRRCGTGSVAFFFRKGSNGAVTSQWFLLRMFRFCRNSCWSWSAGVGLPLVRWLDPWPKIRKSFLCTWVSHNLPKKWSGGSFFPSCHLWCSDFGRKLLPFHL